MLRFFAINALKIGEIGQNISNDTEKTKDLFISNLTNQSQI